MQPPITPSVQTPAFFEQAPSILIQDALAETLGAATAASRAWLVAMRDAIC